MSSRMRANFMPRILHRQHLSGSDVAWGIQMFRHDELGGLETRGFDNRQAVEVTGLVAIIEVDRYHTLWSSRRRARCWGLLAHVGRAATNEKHDEHRQNKLHGLRSPTH